MTQRTFASSADVFAWISTFINLGRGQTSRSFHLERMTLLARLAGNPEKSAPLIHVAGSKGKGSVTGMLTAMLECWGKKTARYTSPHVTEYRERVTWGGEFFEESCYIAAGEELWEITRVLPKSGAEAAAFFDSASPRGEGPSFFELLTLYFFLCARRAKCDAMVVETGLGGRLDATNIVDPLASVIASIELEHTEYLGNTLAAVAGEKAGIVKSGRPLVLMEQGPEALEVFRAAAEAKGAPFVYFPDNASIRDICFDRDKTRFTLEFRDRGIFPAPLDLSVGIPGEIQARNAGLAVLAIKKAFPQISREAVAGGLGNFSLPARFERIMDAPPFIIDGAHTPVSAGHCVKTFVSLYGEGGILIFGCAAKKDARAMARILALHFSRIVITIPGTFKASESETVYRFFGEFARAPSLFYIPDLDEAVKKTLDLRRETGLPVLGTGSFYLAADIRNAAGSFRKEAKAGREGHTPGAFR
ncbi:MAG: bifunctional folylpolyglutamate synthase/dihydrofolate synthase [Spirochaetaceae bacterium]|jgi:dihydrofolate synthase/folylpolyglutamate synthase|nr:bifunctional folylpolyglutamate synthase/dihydrofolate synthase [Spirochaetaceae bacterium]